MTALSWCESLGRVCTQREHDAHNRGAHNDLLGAVRQCGLSAFMWTCTALCNLPFLPWRGGRFGQMLRNARDEVLEHEDENWPLFQLFSARIEQDLAAAASDTVPVD